MSRDRERGIRSVGFGLAASGLGLGAIVFVGTIVASLVRTDALIPALGVASWGEIRGPMWIAAGLAAAAGYLVVLATAIRVGGSPRSMLVNAYGWLVHPPEHHA